MLTIAVVSQKGGAGKTTLAIHLAAQGQAEGRRALLLDLDPQGTAIKWARRRGDRMPDVSAEHPANLVRAIEAARQEGYDLVVIDTAPAADATPMKAAKVADLVVVPCRPAAFDLEAIETTLDLCRLAKARAVVVLNAAPTRSKVVSEAAAEVERLGGTVCPLIVRHRVALQHCMVLGAVAGEYEPEGAAAEEVAALCSTLMMLARPAEVV